VSSSEVDAAAGACDARYLEHDAAALFGAVMSGADASGDSPGLGLSLYYEDATPTRPAPIHAALHRIWAALAAVDAPLHAHLTAAGVEPQLFMLKWLRLLFGREFHFDDVIALWDALIAASYDGHAAGTRPGEMIEAMSCAMILFLRPDLMAARDFGGCLRRLQKFPPVEHVGAIVERAGAVAPAVRAVARRPVPPPGGAAGGGAGEAPPTPGAGAGLGFAVPAPRRVATGGGGGSGSGGSSVASAASRASGGSGGAAGSFGPLGPLSPAGASVSGDGSSTPLRAGASAAAARLTGAAGAAARAVRDALEEDAAQLAEALGSLHTLNSALVRGLFVAPRLVLFWCCFAHSLFFLTDGLNVCVATLCECF
jgi:TBC1 domain family protein 5